MTTKRKYTAAILELPFSLDILAKIASYDSRWYGGTEQDCYKLLSLWQSYQPRKIK